MSIPFDLVVGMQGYRFFIVGLSVTGKDMTINIHREKFLQAKVEKGITYPYEPEEMHLLL